jgi:hypothetical protein
VLARTQIAKSQSLGSNGAEEQIASFSADDRKPLPAPRRSSKKTER